MCIRDSEKYYGTNKYYESHPVIDEELVELFINKKIKMVGFDMPSPDRYPLDVYKRQQRKPLMIYLRTMIL